MRMKSSERVMSVAVSREEWLARCSSCPYATFFHTPLWAELFSKTAPERFCNGTKKLLLADGTSVLVPLLIKKVLFSRVQVALAMPGTTFGGWLADVPLTSDQAAVVMRYLKTYPDLILRENPYAPITTAWDGEILDDCTYAIDLTDGYDAIFAGSSTGHRNAVRGAVRQSVVVEEAFLAADWDTYLAIYHASIERWKKRTLFNGVTHDASFFRAISQLPDSVRKLWLAKVNGKIVAGILCFYWNRHVVVWHGCGLSSYFSYRPNNYLYDRAMFHACAAGYRWFDCNPNGNLAGVAKFKQYLGAKPMKSRVLLRRSLVKRCVDRLRGR